MNNLFRPRTTSDIWTEAALNFAAFALAAFSVGMWTGSVWASLATMSALWFIRS